MTKILEKPLKKTMHIRIDAEGLKDLKKKAKKAKLTVSEYVRLVVSNTADGG
jgi:antitoxin component of RelBE/YafQ-DinJ toxin-antitoxin module